MMPFASFSKTVISDSELENLTAESGVTFQSSNITVNSLNLTSTAFSGSDGFAGYANACYARFSDVDTTGNMVEFSGAMNTDIGTSACYAGLSDVNTTGSLVALSGAMNIDIGTGDFRKMRDILLPTSILSGANVTNVLNKFKLKVDNIQAPTDANTATSRPVYTQSSGVALEVRAR
jgi:hypothetical protein